MTQSTGAQLHIEQHEHSATLIIDNPGKRNALTPGILETLKVTLAAFSAGNTVRCVVIKGAGEKAFSSGYDIGAIPSAKLSDPIKRTPDVLMDALRAVKNFPYPVIAMINGDAFGAGLNLCACCDIRIAAEDIRIGMTAARLGVGYAPEGIRQFIDAFGIARTKELFFTAGAFNGRDLLSKGFVDHLIPRPGLESFTDEYSHSITRNAPLTLKGVKQVIGMFENSRSLHPSDLKRAEEAMQLCFQSDDLIEGQTAFMEKRPPVFKGK